MIHHASLTAAPLSGACLFIGQDRLGRWVVRDAGGLCGGLFSSQKEAARFAMYERERRPSAVVMLPNGLELEGPMPASPPADARPLAA
jgi:hypothetical protein